MAELNDALFKHKVQVSCNQYPPSVYVEGGTNSTTACLSSVLSCEGINFIKDNYKTDGGVSSEQAVKKILDNSCPKCLEPLKWTNNCSPWMDCHCEDEDCRFTLEVKCKGGYYASSNTIDGGSWSQFPRDNPPDMIVVIDLPRLKIYFHTEYSVTPFEGKSQITFGSF